MMKAQYAVIANPQASSTRSRPGFVKTALNASSDSRNRSPKEPGTAERMTPAFAFLKECGRISSQPSVMYTRIRPKGARNVRSRAHLRVRQGEDERRRRRGPRLPPEDLRGLELPKSQTREGG